MSNTIGLPLLENNRIRTLLNSDEPIEFELRSGDYGCLPYSDDEFTGIEITDSLEQEKIIELATIYATKKFGVQSLFQKYQGEKTIKYESCFIDFAKNYVNKNAFLNEISFLGGVNGDLVGKIKAEKCTQIMISFPILTNRIGSEF